MDSTTWWINQRRSYPSELGRQIVFAGTDGRQDKHHLVLGDMQVGDITLHWVKGFLRAIGMVTDQAVTTLRPYVEPTIAPDNGYLVGVSYFELSSRIPFTELPGGRPGAGPFDKRGIPKLGYAFEVTPEWSADLRVSWNTQWPAGSPWDARS